MGTSLFFYKPGSLIISALQGLSWHLAMSIVYPVTLGSPHPIGIAVSAKYLIYVWFLRSYILCQ